MDLLKWFLGMFILFGVIWYISGGPAQEQRPFLRPPAPLDTGEQYGTDSRPGFTIATPERNVEDRQSYIDTSGIIDDDTEQAEDSPNSLFTGDVSFTGPSRAHETEPGKEYVTITASRNNLQPINITGWKLRSAVTGNEVTIGNGAYIPYSGRINTETSITLQSGERAVITTGRSPLGVSFRLNSCTGYLEQFQDFAPSLPQQCPRPIDDDVSGLQDACLDYLEKQPRCKISTTPIPPSLPNACHQHIAKNINYNGCVDNHKTDSNFTKPDWRIYLKRNTELWKVKRETILLLDQDGKLVDSLSY